MKTNLVAGAALVLATCTAGSASTTTVLLRAGDAGSDGVRIGGFEDPVGTGAVVFRGTTAALMTRGGDAFTVLIRTGDPLPPPLSGTFAGFANPVINDIGAVAFRASGAGATSLDGLFLYDAGTAVVVTTQPTGEIHGFDLSNAGHVAFSDDGGLWLWMSPATAPTSIVPHGAPAPGGGTFDTFGRALVNATDTVVFRATVSDGRSRFFTWHPAADVAQVAEGSFRSVAINASGQIALAGTQQVARFDPADASTTVIATRSSPGLGAVRRIDPRFVGIDSAGNVAFKIDLRTPLGRSRIMRAAGGTFTPISELIRRAARDFAPRLTDAGHVAWRLGTRVFLTDGTSHPVLAPTDSTPLGSDVGGGPPSLNASDVVAFVATRGALYRFDGGTPERVAQAGDALPSGETITHVGAYAAAGSAVAFLADTSNDRTVLLVGQDGTLRQVAAAHDVVPPRGRLEFDDTTAIDIRGHTAVFTTSISAKRGTRSGLFAAGPGGRPRLLVSAGNGKGFRYESVSGVEAVGRDFVFAADLRHGPAGLFLASGLGATRIVAAGQPVPGSDRHFDGIDAFAARPGRVLFVAHLDDDRQTAGVFLWRNGRREKLLLGGETLPGGAITADTFPAIAVGDDAEAFVAADASSPPVEAIYRSRKGLVTRLIGTGDPSPLGGTIESLETATTIALRGGALVYSATLSGASAPAALLATSP
jgi:hypothetical protein